MATIQDYLTYLDGHVREPLIKVELLRPEDETVYGTITTSLLNTTGSIVVNKTNGARRSCSFTIINNDNSKINLMSKNTFGEMFRLSLGFNINGEEFFLTQGTFLFENPIAISSFSSKTIQIKGTDKFALWNGSNGGTLEGYYTIPNGTNLATAIRSLLPLEIINDVQEAKIDAIFESYTTPYTIEKSWGETASSILLELAGMVSADVYYDINGILNFTEDVDDTQKGSLWDFGVEDVNYQGGQKESLLAEVYNSCLVVGNTVNGSIYSYEAINNDPTDPTSYLNTGRKKVKKFEGEYTSLINSDELAQIRAEYELRKLVALNQNITITSIPMYHLDVDKVITLTDEYLDSELERSVISGLTIPLQNGGVMSINATRVIDLDLGGEAGEEEPEE